MEKEGKKMKKIPHAALSKLIERKKEIIGNKMLNKKDSIA